MPFPLAAAFTFGAKLLGKLFPDPTKHAEAQAMLLELHQRGDLAELDAAMNVIVAEAKSEHWVTATWRPITMLTFVVIIANNYIIAPYLDLMLGTSIKLEIPPDMWGLLKIGLGGYVIGRSSEKTANVIGEIIKNKKK